MLVQPVARVRAALAFRRLSPARKVAAAGGLYLLWTVTTWLLEGRIETLLRPEATVDRLVYTGVANVALGTVLALALVRAFVASGFSSREELGFRTLPRTLGAVLVAGALGLLVYLIQRPPATDPVVVANAFAQVLPVSIAEVLVCWVAVGGSVAALLRRRGATRLRAEGVALVVASLLFGTYHFAHSPPFNAPATVGLLAVVSVGTGVVYFAGRSVYGALVFHNFLALFGVTSALAAAGRLGAYRTPLVPVVATAVVALLVLVGLERCLVRPSGDARPAPSVH